MTRASKPRVLAAIPVLAVLLLGGRAVEPRPALPAADRPAVAAWLENVTSPLVEGGEPGLGPGFQGPFFPGASGTGSGEEGRSSAQPVGSIPRLPGPRGGRGRALALRPARSSTGRAPHLPAGFVLHRSTAPPALA